MVLAHDLKIELDFYLGLRTIYQRDQFEPLGAKRELTATDRNLRL